MTVPIPISASRGDFGPALSLSYDTGSGNGPFGFGWQLSVPWISRKTDKGCPRYRDDQESDVFIMTGGEDLVPILRYDENGGWTRVPPEVRELDGVKYEVRRYRPRVEGAFARIERWTTQVNLSNSHWRITDGDNVTVVYGDSNNSRISDPCPVGPNNSRIFCWLLSQSYDEKGNVFVYEYKSENSERVDLGVVNEVNRTEASRSAQRYLKRVKHGNRVSRLVEPRCPNPDWMFEVVLDYGEHPGEVPSIHETCAWDIRPDPFSTYRSCFEVRTYRLCKRILMFHHFPNEENVGENCLVSAVEFSYCRAPEESFNDGNRIASFISAVTQRAYQRQRDSYIHQALPPLEFEYSQPVVSHECHDLDAETIENLPYGVDDAIYRWLDLDGAGIPGILTQQASVYFYKANLGSGKLGPLEAVTPSPPAESRNGARDQWMDLAGDGHLSLVRFGGNPSGFYRRLWHQDSCGWDQFKPFQFWPNTLASSTAVQYLDLTGDGLTDVLIANDEVFTWYPSLGEAGYGEARYSRAPLSEQKGIRHLVSSATEAVYAADMSGDGLADLMRIRNGEICYWPNMGYGIFGPKITMDNSPFFDHPEVFHQRRLLLFDIDGSGTTDILYLSGDGVFYYQNESGNGWSKARRILSMPHLDNFSEVQVIDLFGRGTGTLVWSSTSPADTGRHIHYVDLMGGQKPHLLLSLVNNLGAETRIHYSTSTQFYLRDKAAGRPWATRLPFPVQVVERQETLDYVSKNRYVSRFIYHDGFFDGVEREFNGFGMVEQLDTEEFAVFLRSQREYFPQGASNWDSSSHVPPVLTRTWFHTGAYFEGATISRHNETEYYREDGLTDDEFKAMLLEDTILPSSIHSLGKRFLHELSTREAQEACRALKGQQLRQEIYSLDGSSAETRPYKVDEANFTVSMLQPLGHNKHAVFYTHPRESIAFHYERKLYAVQNRLLADPRVTHSMTLMTDEYGNVLLTASVAYGRRHNDRSPHLTREDQDTQRRLKITYSQNTYTNAISGQEAYRTPLLAESLTYELLNWSHCCQQSCFTGLFSMVGLHRAIDLSGDGLHDILYEDYNGRSAKGDHPYRRLLKHQRSIYRSDDLSGPLPLGRMESLALPYETYEKAIGPSLAKTIYIDSGKVRDEQTLNEMMIESGFVHSEDDNDWWQPSGRVFFSPSSDHTSADELEFARQHFFTACRFRDPFYSDSNRTEWFVYHDAYDLLVWETVDPLQNRVTTGERNMAGSLVKTGLDYRLLKPVLVMDPNRNRAAVAYDVLGFVTGSAVMGKPEEQAGDSLDGFEANLPMDAILAHFESPFATAAGLLGSATSRYVYDVYAFQRGSLTGNEDAHPSRMSTLARVTHQSDLAPEDKSKILMNLSYFDGFSRTVQSKSHAGPGSLGRDGGERSQETVPHRFVCNGWTIFNNKGSPVRKYEPFYSDNPGFEFGVKVGVSSTVFYDPLQRVIATLFADDSWSKSTFDPWSSEQWDANDTVLRNPTDDPDVGDFFRRLSPSEKFQTWYERRIWGDRGPLQRDAAKKSAAHADTPTRIFLDPLGRIFLTVEHNKKQIGGQDVDEPICDTTIYDIQGNKRAIIDGLGRKICVFDWDMSGTKIHQSSMEAGELWMLHDVSHNLVHGWDSRKQHFRTVYDALRRSIEVFLRHEGGPEKSVEKTTYGEIIPDPEARNLREKAFQVHDQGGVVSSELYDFKGNILSSQRQFAVEYKKVIDWAAPVVDLDNKRLTQSMRYDAANRKIAETTADNSTLHYSYNEIGLMQKIEVQHPGCAEKVVYLKDVEYNARGQRRWIEYGNKTITINGYDERTFHLKSIVTFRNCRMSARDRLTDQKNQDSSAVQSLHYTYDPIGNVTHIEDRAQQCIFFRNRRVDPNGDFAYDALYRLIEANSREHLGQTINHGAVAGSRGEHAHDEGAMSRYTERYVYDMTGNMLHLYHDSSDPSRGSWARHFAYEETSQIEPDRFNNRLTRITSGSKTERFSYAGEAGVAGNMTALPGLSSLTWNCKNQLSSSSRHNIGGDNVPETTYYRYDARGQRVRKVTERPTKLGQTSTVLKERTYFGHLETFRKYSVDGSVQLERHTLQVADDSKGFALIETRTVGEEEKVPRQVVRYQLSNSIGSISVELGSKGELISYEEYSPYGDTTYSSWRNGLKKRYQYSGKERDEESGLYYYGARYYLPRAHRWLSCDPGGLKGGPNLYRFVKCNPVSKSDPDGSEASWWNRATGILQVLGGATEFLAGVGGIAAPTGVTQVLGAVAVVHGLDTAWAGLKQVYTGEEQKTYTEQGATKLAGAAGASKETAERIGAGIDLAAGILPSAGIALAKSGASLLSRAGSGLKAVGRAITEGAAGAKKLAVEAGHELVAAGKSVVRLGAQVVDDAKKVLTIVKDLRIAATQVAGGPGGAFQHYTLMLGSKGQAAMASLGNPAARMRKAVRAVESVIGKLVGEELHHAYPQEFRWFFRSAGIDIHKFTFRLPKVIHRITHGKYSSITNLELNWNAAWRTWIDSLGGVVPSRQAVVKQMWKMMDEFGLRQYFKSQGGMWREY